MLTYELKKSYIEQNKKYRKINGSQFLYIIPDPKGVPSKG